MLHNGYGVDIDSGDTKQFVQDSADMNHTKREAFLSWDPRKSIFGVRVRLRGREDSFLLMLKITISSV